MVDTTACLSLRQFMDYDSEKVAVVTGGSGANIGRTVATTLASRGARVAVLDIDTTGIEETVNQITSRGGTATGVECDVTDNSDITDAVDTIVERYGGIDVLVNNAGGAFGLTMDSIDEETFDANVDLNLKSAFFTTREALPHLREGDDSSVVYVSSINALVGGFSEVGYATAKGGLHTLVQSLTADYGSDQVRFNVVCPGSVIGDSDVWRRREEEHPGTLQDIAELYPLGRYGDPEDVAEAIWFLTTERAAWISGVVLPVDGGLSATGNMPGGQWWEGL